MTSSLDWLTWSLANSHRSGRILWAVISLLFYVLLCTAIRRRQMRRVAKQHSSLDKMTLQEAYDIKCRIAEHEFPMVFSAAMNFVFFKAEGIPAIAKLIARAAQRSSSTSGRSVPQTPKHSPGVTPSELLGHPGAAETAAAIRRVNRIHSLYRPSGKMSDDDLLYVLSLFALEGIRWVERFDWRRLTSEERCALATLWMALGRELRIPFDRLPSSGTGFRHALHWLVELEHWGREYEIRNRGRSPESVFLGERQLENWLHSVPECMKYFARGLVAAFIEPELRQIMGIQAPSAASVFIVGAIVRVHKFVRGYLCSPWR